MAIQYIDQLAQLAIEKENGQKGTNAPDATLSQKTPFNLM